MSNEKDFVTGVDSNAKKAPKRVVFVDKLPKNASGKILKRELRQTLKFS